MSDNATAGLPTSITGKYVSSVALTVSGTSQGVVTVTLQGFSNSNLDGKTFVWQSTCDDAGNRWTITGSAAQKYLPKI